MAERSTSRRISSLRATALAPRERAGSRADAALGQAGKRRRWLGGGSGGLSGPAIRAVALAQVAAVAARVSIPVVGMGGVQSSADAQELLDVGATLERLETLSVTVLVYGTRQFPAFWLADSGISVDFSVSSGAEAIAQATQNPPDIALMDIRIRGDMDGTEVAVVLRERFNIPVIYLTAHADGPTMARAKRYNVQNVAIEQNWVSR